MKKHIVLLGLFASLFLVAFTTNKTKEINTVTKKETVKIGGAYLTFAGEFGGDITLKKMNATNQLGVAGCASGSLITKFTLKVKRKNKRVQTISGTSHQLNKHIKSILEELEVGDTFQFSKVKAKLPNGRSVDVICRNFTVIA
jgi:hypothetical protein